MTVVERFTGGARAMMIAGVLGVGGLLLTAVGMVFSPAEAWHSYLLGFSFWCGIAVATIIMVSIFHAAKAKWITILRRAMETMGVTVAVFALLAVPLVLVGLKHLYPWHTPVGFTETELHHLHHKQHGYLNVPFFLARQVVYFLVWIFVSQRLFALSVKQDLDGALEHTAKLRRLGPGSLPFLALTITFASFDWLMSLTPLWQSTIYGAYYFAGSFLAAFCVLTIATVSARGNHLYGTLVTPHHLHNLGKLLLAFTAFWAYIGFSQFLLVWVANLPEEVPWYHVRIYGSWRPLSIAIFFGHFVLPFFTLLSRKLNRNPRALAIISVYLLVMHAVDLYWLIWPSFKDAPNFHWTLLTAFVVVGGLATAYALFRAVWCYGPAGYNGCGGEDAPLATRKAWFQRLKRDYPKSRWARELKYYW